MRPGRFFLLIAVWPFLFFFLTSAAWLRAGHIFSDQRLIVWFFDVGQGDAIFIESPDGRQILIDGGTGSLVLEKLSRVMPFWDRSLDAVLLTHPHADHIGGLISVLERYRVERVYTTGSLYATTETEEFLRRLNDGEEVVIVDGPVTLELGRGTTLEIIAPVESLRNVRVDDPNNASIAGVLRYGEINVLLTGDLGGRAEQGLLTRLKETVDVLKVGHHGSQTSTSADLLKATKPVAAIISVGADNSYGHPHAATLDRLKEFGVTVLRTDLDGDIRLTSDGTDPPRFKIFVGSR